MENLTALEKEALQVNEFISWFNQIQFKPYSIYNYYQSKFEGDRIYILDGEGDTIKSVKSYKEFLSWFLFELVNESYKNGQENLRKAIKDLIGLNI